MRVARRTGLCPRTVGPDNNAPQRVDTRDRTTTSADLHHVDNWNTHRKAAALGEPIGTRDFEMP